MHSPTNLGENMTWRLKHPISRRFLLSAHCFQSDLLFCPYFSRHWLNLTDFKKHNVSRGGVEGSRIDKPDRPSREFDVLLRYQTGCVFLWRTKLIEWPKALENEEAANATSVSKNSWTENFRVGQENDVRRSPWGVGARSDWIHTPPSQAQKRAPANFQVNI